MYPTLRVIHFNVSGEFGQFKLPDGLNCVARSSRKLSAGERLTGWIPVTLMATRDD
jgi:hypothetical protein